LIPLKGAKNQFPTFPPDKRAMKAIEKGNQKESIEPTSTTSEVIIEE